MTLYKGYLRTKGKVPIDKFDQMKTLKEVQDCPSYAGVLADDMILIDIDDAEQSEILMQIIEDKQIDCIVRQTTRGRHFLFRNSGVEKCGTHKKLAIGLEADIKVGENTMQVIKIDGEERFVEWDCDAPEPLPVWLHPVKSKIDLLNLDDGQGRNSALYSYILCLTADFPKRRAEKLGRSSTNTFLRNR